MPLTRTLVLVRHAKSAWGLDVDDQDRPLSGRGRRDATALGAFLAERKLTADLAWCSTATRARQTWQRASDAGARAGRVDYDVGIYEAVVDELISLLRKTPPEVRTLIMIGHAPAVPDLVQALAIRRDGRGDPNRSAWNQMDAKYPTSGCAVLDFEGDWTTLRAGAAELESFDVPRADKPDAKHKGSGGKRSGKGRKK